VTPPPGAFLQSQPPWRAAFDHCSCARLLAMPPRDRFFLRDSGHVSVCLLSCRGTCVEWWTAAMDREPGPRVAHVDRPKARHGTRPETCSARIPCCPITWQGTDAVVESTGHVAGRRGADAEIAKAMPPVSAYDFVQPGHLCPRMPLC